MAEVEEGFEKFLGPEGEETIKKAKVLLASGYNILDKARKALDALSELTDAVSHAREKMSEGYEKTKVFLAPGMLKNLTGLYQKVKKFGVINILEDMINQK